MRNVVAVHSDLEYCLDSENENTILVPQSQKTFKFDNCCLIPPSIAADESKQINTEVMKGDIDACIELVQSGFNATILLSEASCTEDFDHKVLDLLTHQLFTNLHKRYDTTDSLSNLTSVKVEMECFELIDS